MYTSAALLDIHARAHRSLGLLLDHLESLPAEALSTPLEGFSYPTLLTQVHHLIGAERYWFSVLRADLDMDDDSATHQTVAALRQMRADTAAQTRAQLEALSDEQASSPQRITKWNGEEAEVVPAHVLLRTQTHLYQHHGEIASMLRQLGHSFPPMIDFPLT